MGAMMSRLRPLAYVLSGALLLLGGCLAPYPLGAPPGPPPPPAPPMSTPERHAPPPEARLGSPAGASGEAQASG
jgi:hypothetical protein